MYIVPLTHNLSITPTYMVQSERKKKLPFQNMSFLNRHMNIHTCIYRFLTLLKNSMSPLYSARKSRADTINARMHGWFGIACRHCAAGKQQVGSTVLQDGCVPVTMLFGQSSNKYTEPSHTSTNAAQWQKEKAIWAWAIMPHSALSRSHEQPLRSHGLTLISSWTLLSRRQLRLLNDVYPCARTTLLGTFRNKQLPEKCLYICVSKQTPKVPCHKDCDLVFSKKHDRKIVDTSINE